MNKFFKSRMWLSMIPYFILGVALIVAFRLSENFSFFTGILGGFWSVITPFLSGAIIAYILNLPCSALERLIKKANAPFIQRKSRAFSVLALILITLLLIAIILNILIPAIVTSTTQFIAALPDHEATVRGWFANLNERDLPDAVREFLNEDVIIATVVGWIEGVETASVLDSIITGFGGVASAVFQTFLAIVSSIYILIEKDRFKAFATRLLAALTKGSTNDTVLKYSSKLDYNFKQYIYTQTIDGIILGSIMTVILLIFRSPHALLLGLILGIVNYIPYFGSIFGTAFAVLVMAITQGVPTAAVAAVIMFAVQQLDGNYIQPKLMGGTFSLSPLLVIISVTVGMAYGGVFGMLVAIPIVAIGKDILDTYIAYREEKKANPPPGSEEETFMDRDIW